MQRSQSGSSATQTQSRATDEFSLIELIDVVFVNRWLIAGVMALGALLGSAYALLGTPIYQANTMVQVEDSNGDAVGSLLGQTAGLFDIRSPASAEMQILRSRLVVGQVVENLRLDVEVTPRYLPVLGRWLAQGAKQPSDPGLLGFGGFVTGNESLTLEEFVVPGALEGKRFRVRLTAEGYELLAPDGEVVGRGRMGQPLDYEVDGERGLLHIAQAVGEPGAQFYLKRSATLDVTEDLQKGLKISEEGKQSGVIRVSLEGRDGRQVANVLNEIGSLYVRQNVERKAAEAEKSLGFLDTFLPQLRQQMEASEGKFNRFRNRNSTFDLGTEGKLVLEQSVKLQTSLLELQQKRKELRALYTAEHFSIRTLDAQIAGINAELRALSSRVKALPDIEQELLRLTRDVKVNNELYTNLLNATQQLRLVKEGKVGNVRIVDVAVAPRKPVKPQRILAVVLTTALGLLAGLAMAFLGSRLRPGLKDPADIEAHCGLHVLANVPRSAIQARHAQEPGKKPGGLVLATAAPQDPAVESFRSLRTALQFAMLDEPNNVVLITGPTPGIGKSFTSLNLAVVLGAANKKVLLIDADLRKGRLNRDLGLDSERGLSEVVSGSIELEDALHRKVAPNLDFLSTGILPPNPAELLMTPAMQSVLRKAAQGYDMVIVDTPPVLATSDTAIVARLAGVVLMLARAEVTTSGELQESAKRLLDIDVNVRGVIFNGLDMSQRRHGLGYKHENYRYVSYSY